LWCIHREFSYRSTGGRILKIGPHLPKLLTNIKRLTFFEAQCILCVRRSGEHALETERWDYPISLIEDDVGAGNID